MQNLKGIDIDNMPAGHRMDVLVAEAMGWDLDEVAHKEFLSYRLHNTGIGMTGWEDYNKEQYRARMLHLAIPRYSTEIAAAWEAHRFVFNNWLFSQRRRYYDALATIIQRRLRAPVAWPDLLGFLGPDDICRAILAAFIQSRDKEKENENHGS